MNARGVFVYFASFVAYRPYPWLFTLLSCIVAALLPTLVRHYSRTRWRIPLTHFFAAILFAAIAYFAGVHFVNDIHEHEMMFYLWGVPPKQWGDSAVRVAAPLTSMPELIREMLIRSSVPVAFSATLAWTFRRRDRLGVTQAFVRL